MDNASKKEIGASSVAIAGRRETRLGFLPALPSATFTRMCPQDAPAGGSPLRPSLHAGSTGEPRLAPELAPPPQERSTSRHAATA